jgi:hypothetical protein
MPDENFTELAGDRVVMRRFRLDDVPEFVAYRSSAQVARFQSAVPGVLAPAWPADVRHVLDPRRSP